MRLKSTFLYAGIAIYPQVLCHDSKSFVLLMPPLTAGLSFYRLPTFLGIVDDCWVYVVSPSRRLTRGV